MCSFQWSMTVLIWQGDKRSAEAEQVAEKSGIWHSTSPTSFVISFCSVNQCVSDFLVFRLVCLNLQMSVKVMYTSEEFSES